MGTFFAGLFRAPMTSVFMVFEVSATYVIILPVMISNTIAYLISRHLEPEALLHVAAHQDGFDLPSVEEQREVPILSVEDAMKAGGARLLNAEVTVNQALQVMDEGSLSCALVASGWGNWSWVQRADLQQAEISGSGEKELLKVLSPRTDIRLYPDLSLDSALRLLGPYPILPVTSRANPNRLLGTLTLEDIHRAYGIYQAPG
jgi:CIC family chloride channel protein